MKKFAIAYLSYFDNNNTIKIIEAESELQALQQLSEGVTFETAEEYIEYFNNGDIAISIPLEIS